MNSFLILSIFFCAVLNAVVQAVPIESERNTTDVSEITLINSSEAQNKNETDTETEKNDLDTAATEDKAISTDYEDNIDTLVESPNNRNGEGNILDAFHKYVNQYGGGPYAPYAPVGGYPAPVGYGTVAVPMPVPAVYPSPYGVQTTYEGYLVPTTSASTTSTTTGNSISNVLSALNPVSFFTNTLPMLMMSTVFRVVAGIISVIGMFFFSGALSSFFCNLTPICDMASNTVTFFMRRGVRTEDVGRMLSEELTPERLKQAEEFVRSAIRKYRDLQKVYQPIEKIS